MAKPFHKAGLITGLASLLFSATVHTATPLNFTAKYIISDGKPVSHRSLSLQTTGNRYTLTARTKAVGFYALINPKPIIEVSSGHIKGNRVKPVRYTSKNKLKEKRNLDLTFDWQAGTLLSKTKPENITYKLSRHSHDMLSETLSLMLNPPGKAPRKLDITTRSRPKHYTIELVAEEKVETTAGTFLAKKYQRLRVGKNDRVVYIWCAPKLDNLPIKIEKHKDGKIHTALLSAFSRP